jgi:hypothetical protein
MKRIFVAVALLLSLSACVTGADDGRYATHDGGRSNFRADRGGTEAGARVETEVAVAGVEVVGGLIAA